MTHDIREYSTPRAPGTPELQLLERLLSADFPGRGELLEQMPFLTVSAACSACPSVDFAFAQDVKRADVRRRVPVEGKATDDDGIAIHMLLHVVDGRLFALEVYREDGTEIRRMPSVDSIEVLSW